MKCSGDRTSTPLLLGGFLVAQLCIFLWFRPAALTRRSVGGPPEAQWPIVSTAEKQSFSAPFSGNVLVTGGAGFIGYHLLHRLNRDGANVTGLDSFSPYYSPALKRARADSLLSRGVRVLEGDVCDTDLMERLLLELRIDVVVHLAAQPGVRHSLKHPQAYVRNNVECFVALLEVLGAHPQVCA